MAQPTGGRQVDGGAMKRLVFIGGPPGVGKTAVAMALNQQLDNSIMLDGDWCWQMHPWDFSAENKTMVMGNIGYLLRADIANTSFTTVILSWVMDEQQIIDDICAGLPMDEVEFTSVSLLTDEATLRSHFAADGRHSETLGDSLARLVKYDSVDSLKVWVTGKSVEDVASEIATIIAQPHNPDATGCGRHPCGTSGALTAPGGTT